MNRVERKKVFITGTLTILSFSFFLFIFFSALSCASENMENPSPEKMVMNGPCSHPGPPPGQSENGGFPPDRTAGRGFGQEDHGTSSCLVDHDISGEAFKSAADEENALRVEGDKSLTLDRIFVCKSAGNPGSMEAASFYGSNAGILVKDGASVTIKESSVTTTASGGNGVFSYGSGTDVILRDSLIRTTGGNSGGVMVAGGGSLTIYNGDIETWGDSAAPLRTDRGGGTLNVSGGQYISHGIGSPAIYSTAEVAVSEAVLGAISSEAVVVEGKNSVVLQNCRVTGNMEENRSENIQNIMIYQSMSGDADSGKGSFIMIGGNLVSRQGDMFYTTNTSSRIFLEDVDLSLSNGVLLKAAGNSNPRGWGKSGENGADCEFEAIHQKLAGKIIVDDISSLALSLSNHSEFQGAINNGNEGGRITVSLEGDSFWGLTGDSYISSFSGPDGNIETNGFSLYVNGRHYM